VVWPVVRLGRQLQPAMRSAGCWLMTLVMTLDHQARTLGITLDQRRCVTLGQLLARLTGMGQPRQQTVGRWLTLG